MVASLLVAIWVLGLWKGSLSVPINNQQTDLLLGLSAIKGMLENGWFLVNPLLGAPAGQDLTDFSGLNGDSLSWVIMRVLGLVITDPVVLLNVFFLLGFALVGGAAYLVLRALGTRRMTALALAVFFANISFHFTRGEAHLMLGMYCVVPAAVWLVLRVVMGRPLLTRGDRDGWRSWWTGTNVGTVLAVIAVGGATVYYGFFTLLLLAIAAAFRALATRRWRALLPGVAVFGATAFVLFLNLLPGIAYRLANGPNPGLAERSAYESALYSFDLTRLVFMVAGHRIERASNFGNKVAGNSLTVGEGDILGLVLGGTFLVMLLMLGIWVARGRTAGGNRGALLSATVLVSGIVFLFGTTGGLGAMFANVVSPQIRAWTRLTPFLAFLCIIVLCVGIDWVRDRIDSAGPQRVLSAALPVVVAAFGVWDGTSPSNRPNYEANAAQWNTDQRFTEGVEAAQPRDGMILQLPIRVFPEAGGINKMGDYEHLMGYIHAGDGLRWSYGAMKGRPADWTATAADLPTDGLLPAAAAAGFTGLWIDRHAYPDRGAALERQIAQVTGQRTPTLVSDDGRRAFYDMRAYARAVNGALTPAQRRELGAALVTPVTADYGAGFYGPEQSEDGEQEWRWASNDATMTIRNGTGRPQRVMWTGSLQAAPGSQTTVTVNGRVAAGARFTRAGQKIKVALPLTVPPAGTKVRFATTGQNIGAASGDPRALYLQIFDPLLVNEVLVRVADAAGTTPARA